MGNDICVSRRKCDTNSDMFGMLCKRPYDKPITVKFEKTDMYYKKRRRKSRKRRLPRTRIN